MKEYEKLIFIGGGVSTIFSLIKLIDNGYPGKKITVIEKGKNIRSRKSNEVMNGFMGAGLFSDGKIVYSLYQGGELSKYVGDEKAEKLMSQMKTIIRRFHPEPENIKTVTIKDEPDFVKTSPFTLRQSETEHLGTDYCQKIGKNIERWLFDNNINFIFEMEVIDIDFDNKKVSCLSLTDNTYQTIRHMDFSYDRLIIATGKSGMVLLNKIINKYELKTSPKAAQIGVRFESEYKYFEKLAKDFYDFKLYKRCSERISMRTFCVNNEAAYVAEENTYGMKSYNGHAYKTKNKHNGLINFGIMMEIKGIEDPLEFTKSLVKVCNVNGSGLYYTPKNRKPTAEALKIDLIDFHDGYSEYATPIMSFIEGLNKIFNFNDDYILYIPEVKYLVNEIAVRKTDLSINKYPKVHVIGDALSSRGIMAAGCQGLYLSESLLK